MKPDYKKLFAFCIIYLYLGNLQAIDDFASLCNTICSQYKRPFTLLDLSNNKTHLTALEKYNLVLVSFSPQNNSALELKPHYEQNLIVLGAPINQQNLHYLSKCEHFDIITLSQAGMLLNNQTQLNQLFPLILKLGDNILLDCPESLANQLYPILEKFTYTFQQLPAKNEANKKFLHITGKRTTLPVRHIFYYQRYGQDPKSYNIISNFNEKFLLKPDREWIIKTDWEAGINLITFLALKGICPNNNQLKMAITKIKNALHPDWTPANMIVQGQNLVLIDQKNFFDEPNRLKHTNWKTRKKFYEALCAIIDCRNYIQQYKIYWKIFANSPIKD